MKSTNLLFRLKCTIGLCFLIISKNYSQFEFKFQNPDLAIEERIDNLIGLLTVEEKVSQLMYDAPAIDRLGIPKYNWWNECLHGVARAGYATVFPQSLTLAASWDKELVYEVASAISTEARAKHHEFVRRGQYGLYQGLTFWSPNINILRDPRWGRGHETYGEDPYLTGQLGKEFVSGLQGNDTKYLKVVATAKHFAVHSGPELLRHEFDVNVNERDLHETYLPAFRTLVEGGKVYSVMGAYNRFWGDACCASEYLFDLLRNKWNFEGYVVSDCGAINDIWKYHKIVPDAASAAALSLKRGCDLNCGDAYSSLLEAFEKKMISEEDINIALKRLLKARFKLGMFDPLEMVEYAKIPYLSNNDPSHNQLARKAACKSIVLLKNDSNMLPLSKSIRNIAVIGPNADEVQSLWGNYNGIPITPVTVLQGIKNKLGLTANVIYEQGCDLAEGIPKFVSIPSEYFTMDDGRQGLKGEYFANSKLEGDAVFSRIDKKIDFIWDNDPPDNRLKQGDFSVRWTGYLTVPKTGKYYFSGWGKPNMHIFLDDQEILGSDNWHNAVIDSREFILKKGKKYRIIAEYKNYFGDATARFLWSIPDSNMLKNAAKLAKKADVIVLVLGLNERLEGEEMKIKLDGFSGGDRTHLNLPETQISLMKTVVATGKPVVLVLINGSALSINWANNNIPAILTAGYPGQQGGNAIADVLFGDYNPAGRLPVTYYESVDQLPPFEDYSMDGRTYRYFKGEPLYPFGYGLSYTSFSYSNLTIPEEVNCKKNIKVTVDVTNTGSIDGEEVVQLYLIDEQASTIRPKCQLESFKRINLKAGEKETVEFTLQPQQLSMINDNGKRVIEPGWFSISVGGKQPSSIELSDRYTKNVITSRFRVVGSGNID